MLFVQVSTANATVTKKSDTICTLLSPNTVSKKTEETIICGLALSHGRTVSVMPMVDDTHILFWGPQ